MTTPEMLALSLLSSLGVAALAYGAVRVFEARVADPVLRDRAWAAALYLSALPVVLTALLLLAPPALVELETSGLKMTVDLVVAEVRPPAAIDTRLLAWAVLGVSVFATLARGAGLVRRSLRLMRRVRRAKPAPFAVTELVAERAARIGVARPRVRITDDRSEALLAGVVRPLLLLPATLVRDADDAVLRAVCAHELAHLKRGDHRALWMEELLLTALATNPLLTAIRNRRAAAREEACDRMALGQADGDARRLYARSLIEALRAPAGRDVPALTFTSHRRIFVMRRLKAVLSPASVAGARSRLAVLGLGVALAAIGGTASVAVAAKREPIVVPAPAVAAAPSMPTAEPIVTAAPDAASAPVAAPVPAVDAAQPEPAPGPTVAPEAEDRPTTITNPSWAQHPMPRTYPAAALEQGLNNGQADLSCRVESDGRVSDCTVLSETPEGVGFGAAALQAAADARLSPRTVDGVATGGTVRFSIRFTMQD